MSDKVIGIRRRFSVRTAYGALELALMALCAYALARLIWALVTPIGPVGNWQPPLAAALPAPTIYSGLDPLFGVRASGAPLTVSDSDLSLYGLRMDQASGRGSAILGSDSEPQRSYAVGEEVAPGLVLQAVRSDHVVLSRGGSEEVLFLDQSEPARRVAPAQRPASRAASVRLSPAASAPRFADAVSVTPREEGGLLLGPGADPSIFGRSGLRPGDVLVSLDGTPISDAATAKRRLSALRSGQTVAFVIERRGTQIPISVRVP